MDKEFLDNLEVRRESFPDSLLLEKRKEAREKREMIAAKSKASKSLQKSIVEKHSIFSDLSSTEEEDRRYADIVIYASYSFYFFNTY